MLSAHGVERMRVACASRAHAYGMPSKNGELQVDAIPQGDPNAGGYVACLWARGARLYSVWASIER